MAEEEAELDQGTDERYSDTDTDEEFAQCTALRKAMRSLSNGEKLINLCYNLPMTPKATQLATREAVQAHLTVAQRLLTDAITRNNTAMKSIENSIAERCLLYVKPGNKGRDDALGTCLYRLNELLIIFDEKYQSSGDNVPPSEITKVIKLLNDIYRNFAVVKISKCSLCERAHHQFDESVFWKHDVWKGKHGEDYKDTLKDAWHMVEEDLNLSKDPQYANTASNALQKLRFAKVAAEKEYKEAKEAKKTAAKARKEAREDEKVRAKQRHLVDTFTVSNDNSNAQACTGLIELKLRWRNMKEKSRNWSEAQEA